ncbi:hypothetical protein GE061_008976 [Apolygus lucorum]|uniref:DUF7869 domain-containing protein n=1 Tax=Apolygus lucorum TaxID=248454 RepID=A0A6A4KE71_APOLU|nr:hypothetical protein GE061_008976 [Apolygus lucorum]
MKGKTGQEQSELITQLRIHKIRAKAFYQLMKEASTTPETVSFVFDLQQVHPLPKTPIGEAFYRRQISFYAFCCVSNSSRDPTFYTWTEVQGKRGSNEIGSALLHYLRNSDLSSAKEISLFCDGCSGQNRNAHIIHLISYWLKKEAPPNVKKVQLTFPVWGHSFLPADRAFGRVEKSLKKISVIAGAEEYEAIYKDFGVVKKVGEDWKMYDLKKLLNTYQKIKGISNSKRIVIEKFTTSKNAIVTKVRCLSHFRFSSTTEEYRRIIKRGRNEEDLPMLTEILLGNALSSEKKKDVLHLLQSHYGENWRSFPELQWYQRVCESRDDSTSTEEAVDEEEECDCIDEDDHELHI